MMIILFIIGGCLGGWQYFYAMSFADRVTKEVYQIANDIFPAQIPPFRQLNAALQPIKCGAFWVNIMVGGLLFSGFAILGLDWWQTLLTGCVLILLWLISRLDWHYQLISPHLCLLLMSFGLGAIWLKQSAVDFDEAFLSMIVSAVFFSTVFYLSKAYYQREEFGLGDCYLIVALSSFFSWWQLPILIFMACILALAYSMMRRFSSSSMEKQIPFAPFLCCSALLVFFKIVPCVI